MPQQKHVSRNRSATNTQQRRSLEPRLRETVRETKEKKGKKNPGRPSRTLTRRFSTCVDMVGGCTLKFGKQSVVRKPVLGFGLPGQTIRHAALTIHSAGARQDAVSYTGREERSQRSRHGLPWRLLSGTIPHHAPTLPSGRRKPHAKSRRRRRQRALTPESRQRRRRRR